MTEKATGWKCPKCGRVFARRDQSHYCEKPGTVDEYIAAQDEVAQPKLNALRAILRAALPNAQECISWSMPTYRRGRNLIHFAASRKHIGLYPGEEAVAHEAVIVTFFYLQTDSIPLQPEQASCTATFRAAFPRYRTVYSFRYTPSFGVPICNDFDIVPLF